MDADKWVVAAKVGESVPATRTDSCGDMEQLELMELILMSEHNTKEAAESAAAARRAHKDGCVRVELQELNDAWESSHVYLIDETGVCNDF